MHQIVFSLCNEATNRKIFFFKKTLPLGQPADYSINDGKYVEGCGPCIICPATLAFAWKA